MPVEVWIVLAVALLAAVVARQTWVGTRWLREIPAADPAVAAAPPARTLRSALSKTRASLRARLEEAFGATRDRDATLSSLEEILVGADVGIGTATKILARMRGALPAGARSDEIREALAAALRQTLSSPAPPPEVSPPRVLLMAGVNGVGKTTTIAKLTHRFKNEGKTVLLVAADTFRAAASEQLAVWGERVGAAVVSHQPGADPAAVAFDGMKAAKARGVDVVIVDTAGRLHTKQNLMDELRKVARVIGREIPGAPHEVLLVLDATTGQNALRQAKVFGEAIGVTGVALTKLDGTAKGGAALAVQEELGVPIRWVGTGEGMEDLRPFDAEEFVRELLAASAPGEDLLS